MQWLTGTTALCAALASFAWAATWHAWRAQRRLRAIAAVRATAYARIGIAATLAALKARVRSGASLRQAFAAAIPSDHGMRIFGRSAGDYERLRMMLRARALEQETQDQIDCVAAELNLAYRLSERLGCEARRCLDAVVASHRRSQMLHGLARGAFAMPEATIRLLSALPFGTLMLGELLGARPLVFLLGSATGWACLSAGAAAYAIGIVWVHAMLRSLHHVAPE
ncbi:hypothetical protein [Bifidobacterium sp.]|jgi:tight adherence protein B|uniref:hypothetical protein n=1 Tax=Bifidobacterium sp. TaxID=41200 RepID=UPI0025BD550C|nr:hypothetical protein [Bifidobacterium sp.]MCH4209091.1 hypothetical protein [Bifidobacterium sp.]MCI1224728.1 hypothetical protein [Bifidobacterium sp.]